MSEVNSIRGYLQGKRTEERIIGVMMLNQILGSDDGAVNDQTNSQEVNVSRAKKEELLMESLVVPGVQFIVRMVETVDAGGRSVPIQLAGLSYIAHACNLGSQIADKFLDAMGILVKVYLTSVNNVVREQTGSAISLLSMVSGTNGKQCVVASILQCVSQHTIDRPFEVLQFLVDIIMTPCLETSAEVGDIETTSSSCEELLVKNPRLLIPAADCPSFRSLIIQGLHGAAPESVRDITLQCCRELLLPVSMSSIVAPHWTFIGSQDPSSGRRKDSFPLLLCSILRGELSILTDEIIFIATHSPESLAQDQSNSISSQSVPKPQKPQQQQPRGETITPTAAGATGTASANDATGSLLGTQTSVSMTSTNRSSHFFRSRIHRTIAMFVTCLQLLESVLHMLVDSYAIEKKRRRSSDDDNNDMKEKGNPLYGDPIIESDPATVTPATNTLKERHASERYQTQRNEEEYDDDDDDDDDDDKDGGQEESLLLGVKCLRDIITAPALPTDVFLPKGRARSQWCAHYVRHVAQYAIRLVCSDVTVASSTGSINTTTTGSSNDTATTPTTAAAAAAGLHGCGRILCAVQEAYEWVASTMHARPQLFIDQGGGGDARQFVIQLALSILPIARHASTVLVSATATASLKPPSKKTANARQQTDTTTAVRKLIRQVSTFVLRVAEEATAATTSSSSIGEFDDSITADVAATMAPLSLALLVDASTLPATTSNSSIASSSLDATSSGINNFWSAMEMVQMQLGRHEAAAHTRWRRSRALP